MAKKLLTLSSILLLLLFFSSSLNAQADNLKKHVQQWKQINAAVVNAYQSGKYQKGIQLAEKACQYAKKHLGKEHPATLTSINDLALLYQSQGRYGEAESLFKEALQLREKVLGKEHSHTLVSINNLASLYQSQGRYGEAEPLFKKALQLSEKVLGKEHPHTLGSINNLALLYSSQGRYAEAELLYKEALQLYEKVLGKEHPHTLVSINNLALLYQSQGRYGEAEPLFKKALQLSEKVLGKEHPSTLTSINNLAGLYESQGQYGEAEPLFKEALQRREKVLGKEHPDTLASMNNLAALYRSQGRYGEAEPLFKEALQLCEKVLGKEHPSTLTSINNLAVLYRSQGRYAEAEPLYKETLQRRENVLGKEHPSTLTSINNLAFLYQSQGRYAEAEPLHKKALQLCEKVLGKEHPDTLTFINNLAFLYQSQGRYGEAEPLYKKALQLSEKVLGKEHPDTLRSINNLSALYEYQGRYGEAEPMFKKALQLSEKVLGKEHPHTLTTQTNYIWLMVNMKNARKALRLFKQMESRLLSRSFQELYSTATDRVRRLYLKTISGFQDDVFSFAAADPKVTHQQYAANVMLRWKQVYAQESAFQHRLLHISRDPEIVGMKQKVNRLRASLSRQMHYRQSGVDINTLWNELTRTEQQIRDAARKLKPDLKVAGADLDQVMGQLTKDSALIEFKMYKRADFKNGKRDELRLAAYLLTSDIEAEQQICFKDLGSMEELTKALGPSKKRPDTSYAFLLDKFDQQIREAKTLYIAPDGFLNLISFAALHLPDGRYLVQRQQINRVQTGRDLLASPVNPLSNELVAFGGVNYDEFSAGINSKESKTGDQTKHLNVRAAKELKGLSYLKHSSFEASGIADIFRTNCKDGKAVVYKKIAATEHRLKNLKQPPRILHLSTHGFYLTDADLSSWAEEAPLLLSGLALCGANRGLKGMVDEHGDDGLLYSMEVLGLNLQGTELVSLSACDTGKGVIDYSEGVYGLVRAFRTAGASCVLMALRPVGDRSSRYFMEKFYRCWLSSTDSIEPAKALHQTRLYFIAHPNEKYRMPDIWSPYVLVGR